MQRPSFESLFRLSPNAYVLLDRDLVILDANQAYLTLLGRALDEIQGRRLHEAFAADPMQPESTRVGELLASFERVLTRKAVDTLPVIRYSIARETPQGPVREDRYWSATHTPLFDERGEVSAILQHTVDITELHTLRQAAERPGGQPRQQLEEGVLSRARLWQDEGNQLRRLFAQAPGFVCFLRGPEHVFELVNEAYQQLVGGARALLGRPVREALPETGGQGFNELLDRVYRTGQPFIGRGMRVMLQRTPGAPMEESFVDFIYQPIVEDDGRVSGIFVLGNDVTEQQRAQQELVTYREHLEQLVQERTGELTRSEAERRIAEQALLQAQKLEAVGKLTGGVAHDFNNMLQIIGGNLQLLRRNLRGDEVAERRLESAVSAVEKGARMATQLLAFASRQRLLPQAARLDELLGRMSELLASSLGQRIEVELRVQQQPWPVFVDVGHLESAILNLAVNAREAMGGEGRLTISLSNQTLDERAVLGQPGAEPGDYVMLGVRDEGCGMTSEVQARAFEPFFTTRRGAGTSGLGLSMVYGFVKQSGGFIVLESEAGQGTQVRICLPRYHGEEGAAPSDAPTDREPASQAPVPANEPSAEEEGGLRILFVEDDPTLRMLTGEVMTELGHEVSLSESAEEALAALAQEPFDVLFTDVGLSGMSGIDLVREAKARHPSLDVVIASGYIVDAAEVGVQPLHTMLKPYDIHRVRDVLAGIQARREGR
ncbi:PAS domain-containing protein [Stutzerimonas azotifigens]|uniref:PAS domain-containing protein n=1 Tax=Stutzerimonas azotifigens TaxID=291995 RepID=UPI0003FFA29E|nr:PAS domain-containing protein [Stutzerimonas azotifigens]